MVDMDMFDSGLSNSLIQDLFHILGFHGFAQIPGDDIAGIIVQHRQQIIPAPVYDL
jgi:hypothetical protein